MVGKITVYPDDIFDLSIEGESGWLYRTANKLHMNTRESVIRGQLLFKTGDLYSDRIVQETERNLRANSYLNDAKIVPVAYDGRHVDLEVRTRDTWTLNPGVNFSRTGGKNEYAVQIQEKNLLGRGQAARAGVAIGPGPRVLDPFFQRSALREELHASRGRLQRRQ